MEKEGYKDQEGEHQYRAFTKTEKIKDNIMKRIIVILFLIILLTAYPSFAACRALLVGIQDYDALPGFSKSGICDLKGAKNDVDAIKKALCKHYGFSEEDIKCLLDKEATRKAIEQTFKEWLINGTRPGDLIVFYFSGHGSHVRDYNNDEPDHYDEVLLPWDMDPNTGYYVIIDDELGTWLSKLSERTVVVIVDSCHSGGIVRHLGEKTLPLVSTPARQSRFIPIKGLKTFKKTKSPSKTDIPEWVIFFTASGEDEAALEVMVPEGIYGGFTYGLCDAMVHLSTPSYRELFDHARKVVKDTLFLDQEPRILAQSSLIAQAAFKASPSQVLVVLESIEGAAPDEMQMLRSRLLKESTIRIVEQNTFFDRLIRGEKKGAYQIWLINRIGDIEKVEPAKTIEGIADHIMKRLEYAYMVKQLAHIEHPNPPFKISLQVTDDRRRDFFLGETIVCRVQAERDCSILIINVDTEGTFHILFPNQYQQDNFLKANIPVFIPNEAMSKNCFQFQFIPPSGEEIIKVIAVTKPFDLNALGLSEFQEKFKIISGKKRESFLQKIKQILFSDGFEWSEDTVVIRSHKQKAGVSF
jgi:hypothetical protein